MEKSVGMDTDLNLVDQITKEFFNVASTSQFAGGKENIAPSQMSPLTLAFIGDCIFDLVAVGLQRGVVVLNLSLCITKGLAVLAHALTQLALSSLGLLKC